MGLVVFRNFLNRACLLDLVNFGICPYFPVVQVLNLVDLADFWVVDFGGFGDLSFWVCKGCLGWYKADFGWSW